MLLLSDAWNISVPKITTMAKVEQRINSLETCDSHVMNESIYNNKPINNLNYFRQQLFNEISNINSEISKDILVDLDCCE